jgi:type I restriction enzyme S subunit
MSDDFEMEVVESSSLEDGPSDEGTGQPSPSEDSSSSFLVGTLPNEWEAHRLDDVCQVNPESFSQDSHEADEFEYISLSDATDGVVTNTESIPVEEAPSRATRKVREGDVLVGTVRPKQSSHGFATEEHDGKVCSSGFGVLRTDGHVNSQYLRQEVLSHRFFRQMMAYVAGSGYPAVKLSDLEKHRIALPPLPEQRKIASVLYVVDKAIQKAEAIIEQAKRVKRGLMQDLFHGRHKSHGEYKSTPIGEVPSHWDVQSIGSVVEMAQYGISESMSESGEYPIFRMNNIENGYMIDEPMKYIDLDKDEFEKYRIEKQDILFNRTNSLELVGKTGIFELEGDYVFASYLVRLRANDQVDPYYLNYYMNSYEGQNRMMDFATKGVSQANINANSIQQVKCPVPPKSEQKEIVSQLRAIDQEIEHNKVYVSQLRPLKTGLMQDLLTGEVRTADKAIEVLDEVAVHG